MSALLKTGQLKNLEGSQKLLLRLVELSVILNSTLDLGALLQLITATATELLDCEAGSILLYDEKTGELTPRGKRIIEHTPQGKLGNPDDLISTIFWLLSEHSSFVTGITVPVDGGFSAYNGI